MREWSRRSDLNRGPAVYELDGPKRCGRSAESRAYGAQLAGSSFRGSLSTCGPASEVCALVAAIVPRGQRSLSRSGMSQAHIPALVEPGSLDGRSLVCQRITQ